MEEFLENITFNNIIEIDEVALYAKRIGPHGRIPTQLIWVFELLERTTGNCLLDIVQNRRRAKVLPIIDLHIDNNSHIMSDDFSVYVNNRMFPRQSMIENSLGHKHLYIDGSITP